MERVLVTGAGGYIGTLARADAARRGLQGAGARPLLLRPRPAARARAAGADPGRQPAARARAISRASTTSSTWSRSPTTRAASCSRRRPGRSTTNPRRTAPGSPRRPAPSATSCPRPAASTASRSRACVCDETNPTNPLTTYARANELAEHGVLPLADDKFCVVVLRQATVYGYSPRMRFDLAINGMTYGAWKTGVLPLMRDGSQWRPMVHVRDTATRPDLHADGPAPRGQRPSVQRRLGRRTTTSSGRSPRLICEVLPKRRSRSTGTAMPITAPTRSASTGSRRSAGRRKRTARDGALEIYEKLEAGALDKTHRDDHARLVPDAQQMARRSSRRSSCTAACSTSI